MHLSVDEARSLSMGVLTRHGYDQGEAELITDVLVEAHLWGRPSSGLNHLPQVVEGGERRAISVIHEDERSVLIDKPSVEAVNQFEDASLDFVFIDATHTYESVSQDIRLWWPKVRPQGLFSGHDYRWSGVKLAVDEFTLNNGLSGFISPPGPTSVDCQQFQPFHFCPGPAF